MKAILLIGLFAYLVLLLADIGWDLYRFFKRRRERS